MNYTVEDILGENRDRATSAADDGRGGDDDRLFPGNLFETEAKAIEL